MDPHVLGKRQMFDKQKLHVLRTKHLQTFPPVGFCNPTGIII